MQKICLDATETKLTNLLLEFSAEHSKLIQKPIILRYTGGWVRDKLLGKTSHDIDVAIDTLTGEEFALALQEFLKNNGHQGHTVAKILRNVDKSKHLETATSKVCGLHVDFVNLRSEEYSHHSRVPIVKFGTPVQDALRRDATLNALFYNLHSGTIEDFTNRGLQDLRAGILRTPIDPVETFRDDPLRILRLLRFVAQFGFALEPETERAMHAPGIHDLLAKKVSRERIGVEIEKLVHSDCAFDGLKALANAGLASVILSIPDQEQLVVSDYSGLQTRLENTRNVLESPQLSLVKHERWPLWLATLLADWTGLSVRDAKNKPVVAAEYVLKEGLKIKGAHALLVSNILANAQPLYELAESPDRYEVGLFVRKAGPEWAVHVAYMACKYQDAVRASTLAAFIHNEGLDRAYELKPILGGQQIKALFPKRAPGPWLAEATQRVLQMQLSNPNVTKEEVAEALR